ncbi:MAG: hypothetical protein SGPRY_013016, partial [Prymnesium sp.]
MSDETSNLRVTRLTPLLPPSCVFEELPGSLEVYQTVVDARASLLSMMEGTSPRLICVLTLPTSSPPLSLTPLTALAKQIVSLQAQVSDELLLILQPPPTAFLQGLTTLSSALPAHAVGAAEINAQIKTARELLLSINRLGLPTALEFGDTITPQFFCDLLSWASVSAQSATLRELVRLALGSEEDIRGGEESPANSDAWALKAIELSSQAHHFLGVSAEGVEGHSLREALHRLHSARPSASLMLECSAAETAGLMPLLSAQELGGRVIGLRLVVEGGAEGLSQSAVDAVHALAAAAKAILTGASSDRLIILVGPASIDSVSAATEYAARLAALAADKAVVDDVQIVMNVRLGGVDGGWPGILMDPLRDGSCQINMGVKLARELLLIINQLGLPTACEFGDTITPQFIADVVAFAAVSAQSATLRELVSGLSMPVGLRAPSAPDGSAEEPSAALTALQAAALPRPFLGVGSHGAGGSVERAGNPVCSVVVSGGVGG